MRRQLNFADGKLGECLDELFYESGACGLETRARVASICRLLAEQGGGQGTAEMVHHELDLLDPVLAPIVKRLRAQLPKRNLPRGAFKKGP